MKYLNFLRIIKLEINFISEEQVHQNLILKQGDLLRYLFGILFIYRSKNDNTLYHLAFLPTERDIYIYIYRVLKYSWDKINSSNSKTNVKIIQKNKLRFI